MKGFTKEVFFLKKIIIPLSFFLLYSLSCTQKPIPLKEDSKNPVNADYSTGGYVKAKVVDFTGLAGCKFLLQLDDGTKLEPLNLDPVLAVNNQELWIKFAYRKEAVSICMSGKVVHLTDVKKAEL